MMTMMRRKTDAHAEMARGVEAPKDRLKTKAASARCACGPNWRTSCATTSTRAPRDVLDGRRAEVMEFRVEQHRDTHMKDGTTLTATMERLFGTKVGTTIEVVS